MLQPHLIFASSLAAIATFSIATAAEKEVTGKAAVDADWRDDAPGLRHRITIEDLPPPFATESARNDARVVSRPLDAQLQAPAGFKERRIRIRL